MQSYVRGINKHISEVMKSPEELLPHEFKKLGITPSHWKATDVIARISALFRRFGTIGGCELTNLGVPQALMAKYDSKTAWGMFNDFYWVSDPKALTYIDEEMYLVLYEFKPKGIEGLSRWVYGSSSFIGTDNSDNPDYSNPHLFDMLDLYDNFEYQPIFIEK
jgi:hypothetical protein